MPFIAIAVLLAVAIGGGTSVAAQQALPGEPLWGFKVAVNERVGAALAAEGKAQADFDIKAIEARMQEAAKLSADARLSAETRASLEQNFEAHAASVKEQVAKLESRGDYAAAADVAARFQATVAAHASESPIDLRATLDSASILSAEASAKAAAEVEVDAGAGVQVEL